MRLDEFTTRAELSAACRQWEATWAEPEVAESGLPDDLADAVLFEIAHDRAARDEIMREIAARPAACPAANAIFKAQVKKFGG